MSDWPSFTVRELQDAGVLFVVDGNHGQDRPRRDEFVGEGTAFIRASDLADGRVLFDEASRISDVALRRIRKGFGAPGDVLFSHKGTVGKLARVPMTAPPFVCSPQTTLWRVTDEKRLRRDWLYGYMRSRLFIDQWWVRKGDTDMADYVSLTAQRQLRIVLPPVDLQTRIAEPLAAIDDLIENNRRRVEVLEEMARAIYREWFVHFRYPGHEHDILVDSPLGSIPGGWTVVSLGDLAKNFDRLRKPLSKAQRLERFGDVPYYGAAKLIDWVDHWIFDGEFLLFAEDGSVQSSEGFPVLQLVEGHFWANNHTHILQGANVSTRFLYLALAELPVSGYVTGAAQPKITQANLNRIPLVVGPRRIHQTFDQAVGSMFDDWRVLKREADRLTEIRDLLLPKLVTGQIDVSSLDLDSLVAAG